MKPSLPCTLVAAIMTIAAPSASAEGLTLNWGACIADGTFSNQVFDCAHPGSYYNVVMNFQPPSIAHFYRMEMTLDLEVESSGLDGFWHFEDGGFNEIGLSVSENSLGVPHSRCMPILPTMDATGHVLLTAYAPGFGGANRARILMTAPRGANAPIVLIADDNYFVCMLQFNVDNSSEAGGPCSGCAQPARLIWQSASLYDTTGVLSGTPGPPIVLDRPGLGTNCLTINGATSFCAALPALNRTWGQLKALYR